MTGKNKKVDFNYVNRAMKHLPNYSENKLVCITNGKEVLRITRKNAKKYFFNTTQADENTLKIKRKLGFEVDMDGGYYYERSKDWFYTTKAIYKQYLESLIPYSKIPAPKFTVEIMSAKGKKEIVNTHIYL